VIRIFGFTIGRAPSSATPSRHARETAAAVREPRELAAEATAPTALYASDHPYLPSMVTTLRGYAEQCRGEAADYDTYARDAIAWAARKRAEAEDFDRAADLVQADRGAEDPQFPAEAQTPPAGYFVHWLSPNDFWPACGEQGEGATWSTQNAEAVTCLTCQVAAWGERVLPTPPWSPSRPPAVGAWDEPLPASVSDTVTLAAVDGGAR
jgi:hypothetical protein